mmetsp:Transcript_11216/g.15789  ORF Transcript_11216/g.15789 Transcript_11216/m.15789 type:complete len:339 (-) Transcript_11216:940-1956(-)
MMIFRNALTVFMCASSAVAFAPFAPSTRQPAFQSASSSSTIRSPSALNVIENETGVLEKIKAILQAEEYPAQNEEFDAIVKTNFPGAMSNQELEFKVVDILSSFGFEGENTLLATSLCCDELARTLEDDLGRCYGKNFFLGGLAGFPFAGNTGFGAMSAHIPDNGFCLIVQAPHVGITQDGVVGVVEREGIELVDKCCGSAIAASNYLQGITDGGATITTKIQNFSDFQQGAVQELILPHGKRLSSASNRMKELPYALFESQDMLMQDIIEAGKGGLKQGTAVLSGIQINTSPDTMDYFHPLRFDYLDSNGDFAEDLLPLLTGQVSDDDFEDDDDYEE